MGVAGEADRIRSAIQPAQTTTWRISLPPEETRTTSGVPTRRSQPRRIVGSRCRMVGRPIQWLDPSRDRRPARGEAHARRGACPAPTCGNLQGRSDVGSRSIRLSTAESVLPHRRLVTRKPRPASPASPSGPGGAVVRCTGDHRQWLAVDHRGRPSDWHTSLHEHHLVRFVEVRGHQPVEVHAARDAHAGSVQAVPCRLVVVTGDALLLH